MMNKNLMKPQKMGTDKHRFKKKKITCIPPCLSVVTSINFYA